eukprot:5350383-Amphidinium_carterae.1
MVSGDCPVAGLFAVLASAILASCKVLGLAVKFALESVDSLIFGTDIEVDRCYQSANPLGAMVSTQFWPRLRSPDVVLSTVPCR